MRLLLDIDGCLAQFSPAFAGVLAAQSGQQILIGPANQWPDRWDWPTAAGYEPAVVEAALKSYADNPDLWQRLAPYDDTVAALDYLDYLERHRIAEIIYATARSAGAGVKTATEAWLRSYGAHNPTVLTGITDKGALASALAIDVAIDDRPEHVLEIRGVLPKGQGTVFLVERPYNAAFHVAVRRAGIQTIPSVLDAVKLLELR